MLPLFQDNFTLGEATSSHFFRVTTSTQQLLFWDSYFFRTAAFSLFFRTVTFSQEVFFRIASFSERNFYRRGTFWEWEVLYSSYFSEQLFHPEELFRIKTSKKSYFFEAVISAQYQFFLKRKILEKANFFRKAIFPRTYLLFLENCLFRVATFSIGATFCSSYLFRWATFLQHNF